ncbi:MAG: hypothetical protein WA990_03365 [Rubrobacteraceae bacterium]
MLKRLMILGGMLAMLLVAAAPAFAQGQGSPVTATGVLGEAYTVGEDPTLNYDLTDEATGTTYVLISGFVDMSPFVGEKVTIEGVPVGGAEGAPPALNVTSLEIVDGGPAAQEIVVITGALEAVAAPAAEGPTHTITEASTGDVYGLFSDAQGVDLSQYEGQSVAIYGVFQTAGAPISDFEDPTDVLIYVTSIESLEPAPVEPPSEAPAEPVTEEPAQNGGTTTEVPPTTGESVLPDTGGISIAAMALISTLLIGVSLLAYRVAR